MTKIGTTIGSRLLTSIVQNTPITPLFFPAGLARSLANSVAFARALISVSGYFSTSQGASGFCAIKVIYPKAGTFFDPNELDGLSRR